MLVRYNASDQLISEFCIIAQISHGWSHGAPDIHCKIVTECELVMKDARWMVPCYFKGKYFVV